MVKKLLYGCDGSVDGCDGNCRGTSRVETDVNGLESVRLGKIELQQDVFEGWLVCVSTAVLARVEPMSSLCGTEREGQTGPGTDSERGAVCGVWSVCAVPVMHFGIVLKRDHKHSLTAIFSINYICGI